jgi:hypothetical protein
MVCAIVGWQCSNGLTKNYFFWFVKIGSFDDCEKPLASLSEMRFAELKSGFGENAVNPPVGYKIAG